MSVDDLSANDFGVILLNQNFRQSSSRLSDFSEPLQVYSEPLTSPNNVDFADHNSPTSSSSADSTAFSTDSDPEMAAAKIELREFEPTNPALWFLASEKVFDLFDLDDEQKKFACLTRALPLKILESVQDIIEKSNLSAAEPTHVANPYTLAKTQLLRIYGDTEQTRLNKLFVTPPSMSQRSSDILNVIKRNSGQSLADPAVRQLFWSRLPDELRVPLTTVRDMELDKLAEHADIIYDLVVGKTAAPSVAAVRANTHNDLILNALQTITAKMEILSARMDKAESSFRSRSRERKTRERSRSHSRSTSPEHRSSRLRHHSGERFSSRYRSPSPRYRHRSSSRSGPRPHTRPDIIILYDGQCWYHYTYGTEARKCRPTCLNSTKQTDRETRMFRCRRVGGRSLQITAPIRTRYRKPKTFLG